jgi:hypothetical protein
MNRALSGASVALLLFAGLVGCGDDDEDPAVQTTPVVSPAPGSGSDSGSEALSGKDLECKDEIVRQMKDKSQETEDTPPECEGVDTDRIVELAGIADAEVKASSAKPKP